MPTMHPLTVDTACIERHSIYDIAHDFEIACGFFNKREKRAGCVGF